MWGKFNPDATLIAYKPMDNNSISWQPHDPHRTKPYMHQKSSRNCEGEREREKKVQLIITVQRFQIAPSPDLVMVILALLTTTN